MCRCPHKALRRCDLCMQGSRGAWGEKRHTLKALVYLQFYAGERDLSFQNQALEGKP